MATNDNHRTKTNQTSFLQFSLIIVFPGDSHYHGCWTCAYSILRLLCFYGLCVSRFNAHTNVCPGLSICAYSWTGFQPVAMIGPCVSLASGVSPYRQDFQGFPSVSWHWTSLFLSHMQTHTNTQTWNGLLTIQLHTNPVEGCRKIQTCATTTESHGSHCALFPWRPQRIRWWGETKHGWKNNLIVFLRLYFVCARALTSDLL